MRLTLRTMLAYMDDILEPADAEQLGKKVQESEFASGLVHRIRNCTRRLRLAAPKLDGKGMGADANTVAEYLDNTLPQNRVPDFEKICLESDVHLAEVASCHQVLALVLGEPAEVDPALRQRVYRLAAGAPDSSSVVESAEEEAVAASAPLAPLAAEPASQAEPVMEQVTRPKPEVPDYLRAPRSAVRIWPLTLTLALTFLVAIATFFAMGGLTPQNPLYRLFATADSSAPSEPVVADVGATPLADPQGSRPLDDPATQPDDQAGESSDPASPAQGSRRSAEQGGNGDGSAADDRRPGLEADPRDGAAVSQDPSAAAREDAGPEMQRPLASQADPPGTAADQSPRAGGDRPLPADPPLAAGDDRPAGARGEGPPTTGEFSEGEPTDDSLSADVGRYISDTQVLARLHQDTGDWLRLPPRSSLTSGDRLLVFPTYRPQIVLVSGVQLTFAGATDFQLQPIDEEGIASLAMHYGRALVVTVGQAGNRIRLDLSGHRGMATFDDAESGMAVEVRHYLPPGADPETVPAQRVVQIFVTHGRIQWQPSGENGSNPVRIDAGQVASFVNNSTPQIQEASLPEWVDAKNLSNFDRLGSEALEPFLVPDRPLSLSLQERLNFRRYEVRQLAVRCLGQLDECEPAVAALNDELHRSTWSDHFDALRAALARSPQSAAQVRIALERQRGELAGELYRLLWGYSPEQLEGGAAERLVNYLDHESLDVRVLAFENLRRITGKTQLYRPEQSSERRRSRVQAWKERLKEGAIVYPVAPAPLSS